MSKAQRRQLNIFIMEAIRNEKERQELKNQLAAAFKGEIEKFLDSDMLAIRGGKNDNSAASDTTVTCSCIFLAWA